MNLSLSSNMSKRQLQFTASIVVALLLHILLVSVWKLAPAVEPRHIPVKTLSVKLGQFFVWQGA